MRAYAAYDPEITLCRFLKLAKASPRTAPLKSDGYDHVRQYYGVDVRLGDVVAFVDEPTLEGKEAVVIYPGVPGAKHVVAAIDGRPEPVRVHPDNVWLKRRGDIIVEDAA